MKAVPNRRKIENRSRKGKDAAMIRKTLEEIVCLPSAQNPQTGQVWGDAPVIERAELTLERGRSLVYVRGLYLDFGRGMCIVCSSDYKFDGRYSREDEKIIPVSDIFSYTPFGESC